MIPLALAFARFVLKDPNSLLFVVFGCFAMLVMSDFGGLRVPRAAAYLSATAVGVVLIVFGTLASVNAWVAALAMFMVAAVMTFARVFGGYIAAGQTGLLLSFVIAISIPAPSSAIPARLVGWGFAGVISSLAATLLWPRFERVPLRRGAARACLVLADAVEALSSDRGDTSRKIQLARQAQQAVANQFAGTAKRPAGPARRDRAFVELLSELDRMVDVMEHPFVQGAARHPNLPESDRLVSTMVSALRSSADVLTGGSPPDLRAVEAARDIHRAALDRWAAQQLRAGRPAGEVLGGLDADHTVRLLAYLALALGSNAMISAGLEPQGIRLPSAAPARGGISGSGRRVLRTIRTHLDPGSTVFQSSLRVALGLAIAVWLARTLALSHAFWVVLGASQVLRSNALATGRTTVQALIGNAIGVIIGGLFALLAGNHQPVMWAALPIAIFLAAYAASAIGFMASQAAFTINLIVIFNLITPTGWQIGLVRLEDLAVGVAISLVVGLLLWPRGARREFARSIADFYQSLVPYIRQSFDRVLGLETAGPQASGLRAALAARDRAGEAFDSLLNEHAASALDPQTAGLLLAAGNHALLGSDVLNVVASHMGYQGGGCVDGARALNGQVESLLTRFLQLAMLLARSRVVDDPQRPSLEKIRAAELECLRRWRNSDQAGRGAMAVVIAGEWVGNLARLEDGLQRPAALAAQAARTPWWR